MKITVLGESNIDITVAEPSEFGGSGCVPTDISFHHGGVSRNIAHNLSLLKHDIKLASVFGGDSFAHSLIDECKHLHIDLSLSSVYPDKKSPLFLCFNDPTGNMTSAFSDAELNSRMDLDWIKGIIYAVNNSDMVVADTLLTVDALSYLIDHCTAPLFIDTVSPVKAMLFSKALATSKKHLVHAVKCNLSEAVAITGQKDPESAAKTLNDMGVEHVYLTLGSEGAVHSHDGFVTTQPALPAPIVNVTGSGDAFFAGIIHAHSIGRLGASALTYGLKAAQHNIKYEAPVNPTLRISIFED